MLTFLSSSFQFVSENATLMEKILLAKRLKRDGWKEWPTFSSPGASLKKDLAAAS